MADIWGKGWAGWYFLKFKQRIIVVDDLMTIGYPTGYAVFTLKELTRIGETQDPWALEVALTAKEVEPGAEFISMESKHG